jgi:hypothetical protein
MLCKPIMTLDLSNHVKPKDEAKGGMVGYPLGGVEVLNLSITGWFKRANRTSLLVYLSQSEEADGPNARSDTALAGGTQPLDRTLHQHRQPADSTCNPTSNQSNHLPDPCFIVRFQFCSLHHIFRSLYKSHTAPNKMPFQTTDYQLGECFRRMAPSSLFGREKDSVFLIGALYKYPIMSSHSPTTFHHTHVK